MTDADDEFVTVRGAAAFPDDEFVVVKGGSVVSPPPDETMVEPVEPDEPPEGERV